MPKNVDDSSPEDFDDLMEQLESLQSGDYMTSPQDWLDLCDKFLVLAEEEPADYIIEPAVEICNYLLNRDLKIAHTQYRLAVCNFLLGNYSTSRKYLVESLDGFMDDETREKAMAFQERLHQRVTRDGKIGIAMIGGLISAGVLWWLSRRSKQNEASQ